jgi:hypothetical protein
MSVWTKQAILDDLEAELDTFSWAYPGGDQIRGEMSLNRDTERLELVVFVNDNDSPTGLDEDLLPLIVGCDVVYDVAPQQQIRALIHWFICHEADEQMYFAGERTFYGHDENGKLISR